jgi:hypothetical protein
MIHQRFKIKMRGQEVEVEMKLQMEVPIRLEVYFHGPVQLTRPTRKELATLCREASKRAKAQEVQ